jgi:hypothetical protein
MDYEYPALNTELMKLGCTSWCVRGQGKAQSHLELETHFGQMVVTLPIAASLLVNAQGQQFIITGIIEELKQRGLYPK